jgi:hypothetical protein
MKSFYRSTPCFKVVAKYVSREEEKRTPDLANCYSMIVHHPDSIKQCR